MKERFIEIPTADGRMETFVTHPEQGGPFPPVILYMDVWGVREELYDLARRVATVGYYAMVPDWYYRQGKIQSTYVNDKGERISLDRLSKEEQDKVLAPARKLADSMVVADTGAILKFLKTAASRSSPTRSARSDTAWAAATSCRWRWPIPSISRHRPACTARR